MLFISQEREDSHIMLHDPKLILFFNHNSGISYFSVEENGNERILAEYPTIQRGREVLERIKNQFSDYPDSVFSFPEK